MICHDGVIVMIHMLGIIRVIGMIGHDGVIVMIHVISLICDDSRDLPYWHDSPDWT